MIRRLVVLGVAAVGIGAGLAPSANAHCVVNAGTCTSRGHCVVNTGYCNGTCTINLGTCTVSIPIVDCLLGHCVDNS